MYILSAKMFAISERTCVLLKWWRAGQVVEMVISCPEIDPDQLIRLSRNGVLVQAIPVCM